MSRGGQDEKEGGVLSGQSPGPWLPWRGRAWASGRQKPGRDFIFRVLCLALRSPAPPKDHAAAPLTQE